MGLTRRKQVYTATKKRWSQKRYRTRFENGLCPMCGKERTGKWIICATCLEKGRRSKQKSQLLGTHLETKRKYCNRYRENCKKEGICYGCGSYIGLGGHTRCVACRDKDRIAHARAYRKKALRGISAHTVPCPIGRS